MSDNYVFPEKWYIQWGNKEQFEVIQGYLEELHPRGWGYTDESIHSKAYVNYENEYLSGITDHKYVPDDHVLITFSQFEKYVLFKTPANKESDDMSQLIKLLKNVE